MPSTGGPDERSGDDVAAPADDAVVADEMVDEAERESYPASDPQSFWAGPDEPPTDHGSEPEPEPERRT